VKTRVSMRKALTDPDLFGGVLQAKSWAGWKILLIAAAGEKLTNAERVEFKRLTGRECEAGAMVSELIAIIGRRAGKSFAMAVFICWIAALCDHRSVLAPGEVGVALCVSRDQKVAKIILGYVEGILQKSKYLRSRIVNVTADAVELVDNISIEVRPCNYKTLRGPTYICVVADEIAHWFTSVDFANPDVEVLASVRPALMTTRGPLLLASSAYSKHGELYDSYRRHFGPVGDPDILVAYGTSRDLNPSLSQAYIDRALARDSVRNRAEYLSEFRDDLAGFIPREIVKACVGHYLELPPEAGIPYYIFVDAASGTEGGDSYAMAVAHRRDDMVVIDAIREARAPFSPSTVVADVLLPLCKAYNVYRIIGDNYAGNYAKEPVRFAGISYELAKQHKSQLYNDPLLSLLNSKKIVLPRHERTINQICSLERSVKRSGRDEILHPAHGHDDLANAVAGAASIAFDSFNFFDTTWSFVSDADKKDDDPTGSRRWQAMRYLQHVMAPANGGGPLYTAPRQWTWR